jgi:hypothetical protein
MNKIVRNRSATPYSIRRELIDISHWEYSLHDRILVAARATIILRTNFAVMPAEILFDAIEAELERRGVEDA